jgi:hypothetical protein
MYISGKVEYSHSPGEQLFHLKAGLLWLTSSSEEKELRFTWDPGALDSFSPQGWMRVNRDNGGVNRSQS